MKKILLVLIGLIPFAVGYGLNALMLFVCPNVALPYGGIDAGILVVWFVLGLLARPLSSTALKATVIAHIPALIVLALLLYQEWVLGQYWLNIFGFATQLFFFPLVYIPGIVTFFSPTMPAVYITAFLLLFAAFWLGGALRNHTKKQRA